MEAEEGRLPDDGLLQAGGGMVAAPSPATAGRGQPEARVPVIPSPRQGGMELCGRSRAGAIKRATTPPGGGHDIHEHAPGCARAVHIASLAAGAGQRAWACAKAVEDQGQQPAGGRDAADAGAAPAGDAVEVDGLLAGCGEPLGGLGGSPADPPGAPFGDGAAAHGGVGLTVTRREPGPGAQLRAPAKRCTFPISATNTAASTGPTPGMAWMARQPTSPANAAATSRCRGVISWS